MCLDAAISTDDVGIGSPAASTGVLLADIAAGAGGSWGLLALEIWGRRRWGQRDGQTQTRRGGDDGGEGEVVTATLSASFVPSWASECETTGLHVGSFCRVYVYREFGIFDNAPFAFVTSSARFQRPLWFFN
jgi:hypothetical protein